MKNKIRYFLLALAFSFPFWGSLNILQKEMEKFFYAQISSPFEKTSSVAIKEKPLLEIQAKSAISLKINKFGREKNILKKESGKILPIASLTKLMTALIVFENPEQYTFSKFTTISAKAAGQENAPEYGNLKAGEKETIGELLELTLLYSSNDAAFALSEIMEESNFVEKMNQKAEDLKLKNTHFVNPTGLDPANLIFSEETKDYFNYSTAEDLSLLSKYILNEFPIIFEISSKKPYFQLKNGFSDLSLPENLKIIGGKTGYTNEAGGCIIFILFDEKERYFINVILGTDLAKTRIEEAQKLIDYISNL